MTPEISTNISQYLDIYLIIILKNGHSFLYFDVPEKSPRPLVRVLSSLNYWRKLTKIIEKMKKKE